MKQWFLTVLFTLIMGTPMTQVHANEYESELTELAQTKIKAITTMPVVIDAIKKQNQAHANLTQDQIDQLDKKWRAEVGSSNPTMINQVLANPLSKQLKSTQSSSNGMYTEIFVMDNKGLNVGQSSVTSDYWQGDEAKWQDTFLVGSDAIHISDIEEDESTQTFQSQVSMSITDPDTGKVIGAITVGVNVEAL